MGKRLATVSCGPVSLLQCRYSLGEISEGRARRNKDFWTRSTWKCFVFGFYRGVE
jgi:hypothetical protein